MDSPPCHPELRRMSRSACTTVTSFASATNEILRIMGACKEHPSRRGCATVTSDAVCIKGILKILLNIVTELGSANVKADYSKPCVPMTIGGTALAGNTARSQGYDTIVLFNG